MKIFHNAVVYTGQLPLAQAFAVDDGKFVFVGTNAEAAALGFRKVTWFPTGCVITCHGGPGAFGIVGVSGKE